MYFPIVGLAGVWYNHLNRSKFAEVVTVKILKTIRIVIDAAILLCAVVVLYRIAIYYLGKGPYLSSTHLLATCIPGLCLCGSLIRKKADRIEKQSINQNDNNLGAD